MSSGKKTFRLGLLGLGPFNIDQHAPALQKYSKEVAPLDLVLHSTNAERLKKWQDKFGVFPVYNDVDKMIAEAKLDAAYITIAPHAACEVSCKFMKAGIPVFTEKPPGVDAKEARILMETAGSLPHAVGFNRRFSPSIQKMREIGLEKIGPRPLFIKCSLLRWERYNETFYETVIHGIDTVRYLGGDFVKLTVTVVTYPGKKPIRNYNLAGVLSSGAMVQMEVLPVSGASVERYWMVGEDVYIEGRMVMPWLQDKGGIKVSIGKGKTQVISESDLGTEGAPEFIKNGVYAQTKLFLDGLRNGTCPGTSFKESVQSVEVMDFLKTAPEGVSVFK